MKSNSTINKKGPSALKKPKSPVKARAHKDAFTKTVLEKAARKGIREAENETIKVMGYNLIVKNGWVVKVFPNNKIVRISRVPKVKETI